MWDDAQSLRQLSNALLGISLLLVLFGTVHYLLHLPDFPLRAVQLGAAPQRVSTAQIEEVVRNELHGNFFTADLGHVRKAFEQLPWVRQVSVRRRFPGELEVNLEEHVAVASWNGSELVNTHGEVFAAECENGGRQAARGESTAADTPKVPCGDDGQVLPRFVGQPDTSVEVMQMYKAFSDRLAPLKQRVAQISLSPRRAWQLRLDNGMVLELGREQAEERLARFVAVYPYSLAAMQHSANYVDLRYRNGFAAYLPGGMASGQPGRG